MKNTVCLFAICICQFFLAALSEAQEKESIDKLDSKLAAISEAIQKVMKLHDVPAVSSCIVVGDDSYFLNHGTNSRLTKQKVDERSIYQIASLSKTFVGLVAHQMLRKGTIKTNDSIANYLPETIDEETRRKVQPISVLDLLCHRSGLPRDTLNQKLRQKGTYVSNDYEESDMLADLKNMELAFVPGERFMYSNFGYSLLAYLLERASGKQYGQLVIEHVTGQLEMSDTRFVIDGNQLRRLVTAYDHNAPSVAREPARIGKLGPPTSLYSTTSDLSKLMKKQLAEYRDYQKTKAVTKLILTQRAQKAWPGTGIKYGFGLFDWGNGTFGHGGGMDGYGSEFSFDPKRNFGFILLTSSCETWTQRLSVAVGKVMADENTKSLDEWVAVENIVSDFEKKGPNAALKTYRKFRNQKLSPLGSDARITLVNLARQIGMSEAAKLFARDALADFPDSKRIQELVKSLDDKE